ncbi:ferredoxin [Pigmentiphaga sp.]|uniref:ferredoxin n=1 Tax=Pigmentiphaga sp. TaxID=1977564 RepID=UPI0012BE03C2|nr:ferredoxin [Pigmentiphaga sp.]MPS27308.1 ferredoxin [Alcaligenaceae bacterium SAGV5]MPS51546.1 ferredoxin [Alcaligenaceae bacterium SAGV3]MPT55529.1 ferredoxin [Alcaligenaceae bacterium]
MYIILTSKPGIFHTESGPDLEPVEAYDYVSYGKTRAHFIIARLARPTRVRVIEDEPPHISNTVPSKFLPQFPSLEQARAELAALTRFGTVDGQLILQTDAQARP